MSQLIMSRRHPLVKHLFLLRTSASYRKVKRAALAVGRPMVADLLACGGVQELYAAEDTPLPEGVEEGDVVRISGPVMERVTGMAMVRALVAVVALLPPPTLAPLSRLLVLDGVSDPGNMGMLIRCALAFGWEGLFLLPGCCDAYNDKALRAAAGATFKMGIGRGSWEELKGQIGDEIPLFGADLVGLSCRELTPPSRLVLVIGAEGRGLSPQVRTAATAITVPTRSPISSLNAAAAGAILLYLLGSDAP